MARTLYLSDLDGTLLNSAQRVSTRTCEIINRLTGSGMLFSCATARSRFSSGRALEGLSLTLPMILYNGAFIQDCASGQVISGHFIRPDQAKSAIDWYISRDILPIVYSFIDGREHFSYVPDRSCPSLLDFVATREGDPRTRITDVDGLDDGDIFYITAMGEEALLREARDIFSLMDDLGTLYYREIYSGEYWLELMHSRANKADAAMLLKERLGCDRLVCFGDSINDLPMFRVADRCFATANADPRLKEAATEVIGSNDEDAVALWLEQYGEI